MINFRLLKESEADIKFDTLSSPTDFAITHGGETGEYWIDNNLSTNIHKVGSGINEEIGSKKYIGARVVTDFDNISELKDNISFYRTVNGAADILEFGCYPQTAVDGDMQRLLESKYKNNELERTNIVFSAPNTSSYNWFEEVPLTTTNLFAYKYNDRLYVRDFTNTPCKNGRIRLSNGLSYNNLYDNLWIEVEPIKWKKDDKRNIMISDKILFAGVPYSIEDLWKCKYDSSEIKKYIDSCFSRQVMQTKLPSKYIDSEEDIKSMIKIKK